LGQLKQSGLSVRSYYYSVVLLALIGILLWKAFKGRINSYENIVIAFAIVYGLFIVISASNIAL